jgi:hypothetical protein
MDNKGSMGFWVLAIAVIALVIIVVPPMLGINLFAVIPTGDGDIIGCNPDCNVAPSVLFTAEEQFDFTTSDTTSNGVTYFSGGLWTSATPLTAETTVTACQNIKYAGYVDSTTNYGVKETTYAIRCGNQEIVVPYWTIATYTSVSNYVKNNDGTVNSATNRQGWSAGDVEVVTISWTGQYETAYGHPDCGNVMVVDVVNATRVDDISSTDMTEVGVPDIVTVEANHDYYAFKFPAILSSEEVIRHLTFDIDDTYGYGTDNVTITLYDCQQYFDSDDNTIKFGVEDEADSNRGLASHDTATIYTV